jgi:hypothetical protein
MPALTIDHTKIRYGKSYLWQSFCNSSHEAERERLARVLVWEAGESTGPERFLRRFSRENTEAQTGYITSRIAIGES